jgi:hypothetical protein
MNVKEKLWPGARFPELKRPPSAVAVWVVASRFVNVTRVPVWTLRLEGVNAKPAIAIDTTIIGGTVGFAVGAGIGRGVETTGCGVDGGVSTGVGEADGDGVNLVAAEDRDGGGDDCLVACEPQAASKHATMSISLSRTTCSSVRGNFFLG